MSCLPTNGPMFGMQEDVVDRVGEVGVHREARRRDDAVEQQLRARVVIRGHGGHVAEEVLRVVRALRGPGSSGYVQPVKTCAKPSTVDWS